MAVLSRIGRVLPLLLAAPASCAGDAPLGFEAYLQRYGLSFADSELAMRRSLYVSRVATITAHNAQERKLWTAGINELTVATDDEIQSMMGYNKALRTTGGARPATAQQPRLRASKAPPKDFDWRGHKPNVVTAVKSQGGCGSCWAFAAAAVLESHIALKTGVLFDLSPQQLNSCVPNERRCGGSGGCSGATPQLAFNYTAKAGINTQWNYPYMSGITRRTGKCLGAAEDERKYKLRVAGIQGYMQLPQNDAKAMMDAILEGPVAVTVAASHWYLYEGGVFEGCNKQRPILNHAVVVTGYGEEKTAAHGLVHYWSIRNSWSATWGEKGYIRLRRYPDGEPCGVDDLPLYGYSCVADNPDNVTACGECGILSDSSYPTGAFLGAPHAPEDPALGGHR